MKFRWWGRLNLNIELLQTKCSDLRFNLTIVKIHNTCHVIVSPVCVCSFQIYSGLMKLDVINRNGNFQFFVSLLYAHYPICFLLSCKQYVLYIVQKKFESTNMDLTHLYFLILLGVPVRGYGCSTIHKIVPFTKFQTYDGVWSLMVWHKEIQIPLKLFMTYSCSG